MSIQTFVFIDLETTGFRTKSSEPRITEFCLAAVHSDHINSGVTGVQNKLCLCINPCKVIPPRCTEITGLTNELLKSQPQFDESVVNVINAFLDSQKRPICFVAHNGNRFDYPIFKAEIIATGAEFPDDILCVDSLQLFKDFYRQDAGKEKTDNRKMGFKLTDVYTRLTRKVPIEAHRAECDVSMLIECVATLGQRFTEWANENARDFHRL